MCADPVSRSEVLAWVMRGRCPVEQGGIGNAREVERATAQVRDSMDEFRSFVSTARSAERSFSTSNSTLRAAFDHYVGVHRRSQPSCAMARRLPIGGHRSA